MTVPAYSVTLQFFNLFFRQVGTLHDNSSGHSDLFQITGYFFVAFSSAFCYTFSHAFLLQPILSLTLKL